MTPPWLTIFRHGPCPQPGCHQCANYYPVGYAWRYQGLFFMTGLVLGRN